jgi:DNA-binding PadR family transcriptional regulator
MHLTSKQIELLTVISRGNADGSPTDLDEVIERVSWHPTKQSIQFSIRALLKHELIEKGAVEKRRGRNRVIIKATKIGAAHVGTTSVVLGPELGSKPSILEAAAVSLGTEVVDLTEVFEE